MTTNGVIRFCLVMAAVFLIASIALYWESTFSSGISAVCGAVFLATRWFIIMISGKETDDAHWIYMMLGIGTGMLEIIKRSEYIPAMLYILSAVVCGCTVLVGNALKGYIGSVDLALRAKPETAVESTEDAPVLRTEFEELRAKIDNLPGDKASSRRRKTPVT